MRYTLPNLQPGSLYAIQVRAIVGTRASEFSRTFVVETTEDTRRPDEPQNVEWYDSGDSFHGEWDSVTTNEEGTAIRVSRYEVELVANGVTQHTSVPPQEAGGRVVYTLSFEANRALFGTPRPVIAMRVRAINANGVASLWSTAITASNPVPAPPTNASGEGGPDIIVLSWDAPSDNDLTGYNVYTGSTADFTPSLSNRIMSGDNVTSFVYHTTSYFVQYFKIRSVDKFNQESTDASTSATPDSPFIVDTAPPENARNFLATPAFNAARQTAHVDLTWNLSTSTDVQTYVIRYSTNNTNWQYVNASSDTTSLRIDNLAPGTQYYFGIRAVDFTANESTWAAAETNPITTPADTAAPSTPAAPAVASNTMQMQFSLSGKKADNSTNMELDTAFYEAYAGTTANFTANASTMLGVIPVGPAMVATFDIPANASSGTSQTWYGKVVAVDRTGNKSAPSAASSGANVNLIGTANIGDATITNAKITELSVSKLTAGTGLATDFTIKSKLTLGDATTDGAIESFDYSGGTSGFRFAKSGLVIRSGSIEAPALKIQMGNNLMPAYYADFENDPSFYLSGKIATAGGTGTVRVISTEQKFHTQCLEVNWQSGDTYMEVNLSDTGSTTAGYNIHVDPNKNYLASFYAKVPSGTGSKSFRLWRKDSTGGTAMGTANSTVTDNGQWQRVTVPFTTPSGVDKMMLAIRVASTGIVYIDGVQVEEKLGALETASVWSPPGATRIDGGMIRTGQIISSTTTDVNGAQVPTWSIPLNGSASFANLQVRGNAVLGTTADGAFSTLSSANYVAGTTGWQIRSDGTADLRGIGADSIVGDSIIAGSLSALSVKDSNLSATIRLYGSLLAEGSMGERVIMGEQGFEVYGAWEAGITAYTIASGVATITTNVDHGYPVGSTINISGVGAGFDGKFTIASVPSATTLTFTTTATTAPTGLGIDAMVQGRSVGIAARDQPRNVYFPTDGSRPNIVSGLLNANALTVNSGAILNGESGIGANASLTIASKVNNPVIAPQLTATYNGVRLSGIPGAVTKGVCFGANGNMFVLSISSSRPYGAYISEHNKDTGVRVTTPYYMIYTVPTGYTAMEPNSLIYAGGRYYMGVVGRGGTGTTFGSSTGVFVMHLGSNLTTGTMQYLHEAYGDSVIGWDYTASKLLTFAVPTTVTSSSTSAVVRTFDVDSTTGAVGAENGTAQTLPDSSLAYGKAGFITKGNFYAVSGAAVTRFVYNVKPYSTNTDIDYAFRVCDTTMAMKVFERWPVAEKTSLTTAWYDDTSKNFYHLSDSGMRYEYQGGEQEFGNTQLTVSRFVGYTWYDNNATGAEHETIMSPRRGISLPKRARLAVTLPSSIPKGAGTDTPNAANIYLAKTTTDPGGTGNAWRLGGTIMHPSISASISAIGTNTLTFPRASTTFDAISAVGQIKSATGNSFWKGDDTAQFYSLMLRGGDDAELTYANKPPLRIRDKIGNQEMRFDGNEIMVVGINDAPPGTTETATLFVQREGGRMALGQNSRAFSTIRYGQSRVRAPSPASAGTGIVVITHNMGVAPEVVTVTPRGGAPARYARVQNVNATTFEVVQFTAASTQITGTDDADFDWIAIAT